MGKLLGGGRGEVIFKDRGGTLIFLQLLFKAMSISECVELFSTAQLSAFHNIFVNHKAGSILFCAQ